MAVRFSAGRQAAQPQGKPKRRRRWLWATAAATAAMALLVLAWPYRGVVLPVRSGERAEASVSAPRVVPPSATAASQIPAPRAEPVPPPTAQQAVQQASSQGAAPVPPRPGEIEREVFDGDTLYHMAVAVYGFANDEVIRRVIEHNPSIENPDTILIGTVIRFPDVSDIPPDQPVRKRIR